jgi:hypothetical protein
MRIFVPRVLERQVWIVPCHQVDAEALLAINGPRTSDWQPVAVKELLEDERGRPRRASDMPWCAEHLLALRGPTLDKLQPVLEPYGEFLKLIADTSITLFNATICLEALDEDKSGVVRFDDGSIMTIERHAFRPAVVRSTQIFRLRLRHGEYRLSPIFLQEAMIDTFRTMGIRGVGFELVWDGDRQLSGEAMVDL